MLSVCCESPWAHWGRAGHKPPPKQPPLPFFSIQVRYGRDWSDYAGGHSGELHQVVLHPGETITQVSGMADSYLRKLKFHTNFGRQFSFGTNVGTGFSGISLFPNSGLSYISGRADSSYVYAIAFHWNSKCPSDNKA